MIKMPKITYEKQDIEDLIQKEHPGAMNFTWDEKTLEYNSRGWRALWC